MENFSVTA